MKLTAGESLSNQLGEAVKANTSRDELRAVGKEYGVSESLLRAVLSGERVITENNKQAIWMIIKIAIKNSNQHGKALTQG